MGSSRPPPSKPLDLDLTIISAKHLKNVNWKVGDLKPYCVFWVEPDRRLASRSDESGSTRPVWNDRFTLPLIFPLHDSVLALDIFHSIPSETPKPLVATLRVPLKNLPDPEDSTRIRKFDLLRPSGRPQGKIRMKIGVRERPLPVFDSYHFGPPPSYCYNSAPLSPYQTREYREFSPSPHASYPHLPYSAYPESYTPYSPGHCYSSAPPRPFYDRTGSGGYGGGPSAPFVCSSYDQKVKSEGKRVLGTGLCVGAVAGGLGGLSLEEGSKYGREKFAGRVKSDLDGRDDDSEYRAQFYG